MTIHNYKSFLRLFMIAFTIVPIILNVMETRAYANQLQIDFSGTVNGESNVLMDCNPLTTIASYDPVTGLFSCDLDGVDINADSLIKIYKVGGDITIENKSSEDSFEVMSVLASGPDITVTDSFGNTGVYSVTKFYLSFLGYNLDEILADTLPAILKSDWVTPFSGLIYDYKSNTKVQNDYHQDYDQVGGLRIIQFAHFDTEVSIILVLGSILLGIGLVYLSCKLESHFNRGREL
jgi:hypothetical protein